MSKSRVAGKSLVAGMASLAAVAAVASPADAHGFSNLYNWGCPVSSPGCTHAAPHNLSTTGVSGNVVGLWQAILYQNGLYGCSSIDGAYGSGTTLGTKKYQHLFDGGNTSLDDGVVGPITYGWVQNPDESWEPGSNLGNGFVSYFYAPKNGIEQEITLYKNGNSGGTWKWSAPFTGGNTNDTNHPGVTFGHACP
jgi:hypothetical protein